MKYTEEQLDAMSSKVGFVLGERLNGQAENIPDDEIWGAWMVMEAFYPPDALELLERYQALMEIQGKNQNDR